MTTTAFLGIDIAKRKFDAFLQLPPHSYHRQFANTASGFAQLQRWLHQLADGPIQAGMEATSRYGEALAVFLHQAGIRISVINPARVHAFAKSELARNKTDKLDAAVIARFVATQAPAAWTPPPLEQRQLQAMIRRLDALQAMRQAEQNRLDLEDADSPIRESLVQHLGHLDEQLRQRRRDLAGHVRAHPTLQHHSQLLQSIPGIGETTALKLLAELPALAQQRSARQVAAYAGLNPAQRCSGSSVRGRSPLSKIGNPRLRRTLYLPAIVASRHNPLIRPFAQRLRERGKAKMVIVGAAMRKLLHQACGVLKHGQPFDPNYALTH